jgi:D-xylose transport system permease protein
MTAVAPEQPPLDVPVAAEPDTLRSALGQRWEALKAGDVGSLPVAVFMVAIVIFFTLKVNVFFSAVNFTNLVVQMTQVTVMAIGVVFVLLIGEIDLSIGYVSGVAGVVVAELQLPGSGHDLGWGAAIVLALATGAAIGVVQGSFVAFLGVPSFVVTLAGLLAWQGVIIQAIGTQGVIGIQSKQIIDITNYFFADWAGWLMAAIVTFSFAVTAGLRIAARRRAGLGLGNLVVNLLPAVGWSAAAWTTVAICNHDRGVPFAGVLMVVLLLFWTFIAQRTTFGRHVYAVGGNAEAARRAGINVAFIRVAVFAISGLMAAMGGIVAASFLNNVDLTAGGGTILLDAISAAVIGGVSLFGGRGFVKGALLGAMVTQTIANGIDLVGYSDAVKDIVTGVILLAAVTLDTVSRRRLAASGR